MLIRHKRPTDWHRNLTACGLLVGLAATAIKGQVISAQAAGDFGDRTGPGTALEVNWRNFYLFWFRGGGADCRDF
jgi:hypothetical protein